MGLMIACILIYQFEMHWGFYALAALLYLFEFGTINKGLEDLKWQHGALEKVLDGYFEWTDERINKMEDKILEDLWKVDERIGSQPYP